MEGMTPMNQTNVLATRQATSLLPDPQTWKTMADMADALFRSGLLPASIKSPQAAVAVIQKGTELGIPPMYALSNIVVIQGKPTANAELMLALIYRDHGDGAIVFTQSTNSECEVAYKRRSWTKAQTYTFTMADAQQASLLGNQTWQKYPAAMLRARCISAVARMAFPDSIGGMYTSEELGADVDVIDGEVVIVEQRSRETVSARELSPSLPDVQVDVETGEVVEPRSIVDVLSDEIDATPAQVDDEPLVMTAFDMLDNITDRRDLNNVREFIDANGLRGNESVMNAYTQAYEEITGKKAPKAANDAQTALQGVS